MAELPQATRLIAVSKFHPASAVQEAYDAGQRVFGESRLQELQLKQAQLPKDIEWHFIGHLQSNKVKQVVALAHTIHTIDSIKLLAEVDRCALKEGRTVRCLLQIHIAQEETKYGFDPQSCRQLLTPELLHSLKGVEIVGLMGMATYTDNLQQVREEFKSLATLFRELQQTLFAQYPNFCELSMGMSDDYSIAIEEGSTYVRIGSSIFGSRE